MRFNRVHYDVEDLVTKIVEHGLYDVTDIRIDPEDETKAIGTWLLSQNVTNLAGSLTFVLKCQCFDDDGNVTYSWSTDKYVGFSISPGISNTDFIVVEYADLIAQWEKRLFGDINNLSNGKLDITA